MSLVLWIAIALACFVLPATDLTNRGRKHPDVRKLHGHADHAGLPLTEEVLPPVVARIRRRQRGMSIGGVSGIVLATVIVTVFFDSDDGVVAALVFFMAAVGAALGGAWGIAAHRPAPQPDRPAVARLRTVGLSDYLTRGERFGFWFVPATIIGGAIAGSIVLAILPALSTANPNLLGGGVAIGAIVVWIVALFSTRSVLAAPARNASELELAWDDAERAGGLRQVVNLTIAIACMSLLFWLSIIGNAVISNGFYREDEALSWLITGISLLVFGGLAIATAAGPMTAWLTGQRKGYEQRRLWPSGVSI